MPVANGFCINVGKIIKSIHANNDYRSVLSNLCNENMELTAKLKYFKSSQGMKILIKDRLNMVEKGELLIKFNDSKK